MTINDLLILKDRLGRAKIGSNLPNDELRKYLKITVSLNKYETEFNNKRMEYAKEAAAQKGYDLQNLTDEQNKELLEVINPLLNEWLTQEAEGVETKVFTWDTLCDAILNNPDNKDLNISDKSYFAEMLCSEEL